MPFERTVSFVSTKLSKLEENPVAFALEDAEADVEVASDAVAERKAPGTLEVRRGTARDNIVRFFGPIPPNT